MDLIRSGRSLLFRQRGHPKPHLWFILANPAGDPQVIPAAMVRTKKHYTDSTLVLGIGDHPFIKHESCVDYSSTNLFRVDRIQRALAEGTCHLMEDMDPMLLERVREGLIRSPYTVRAIAQYCKERFAEEGEGAQ